MSKGRTMRRIAIAALFGIGVMLAGCQHKSAEPGAAGDPARCPHMKGKTAEAKPTDAELPAYSLVTAAKSGDIEGAKRMLADGVDIDTMAYGGGTALHAAAEAGQFEMTKFLVESGAIVNIKNKDGKTPVNLAGNHAQTAKYLIGQGAEE